MAAHRLWGSKKMSFQISGPGTNLKVGGTGPAQKRGAPIPHAQKISGVPEIFFLVVPLPLFSSKSTISRFGERFRDGQYSLISFLFAVLLLTVPPCPAICKSGGTCPLCPMESAPLLQMALEAVYRMTQSNVGRQRVVDCSSSNRERASSELGTDARDGQQRSAGVTK